MPDMAPKSVTILTRWCAVFIPPASRVAAGISQSLRVSPDTVVRGEKLLPLYSLLSMICLQTSRIVGVKVPESLPLITKVWDLPV